MIFLWKYKVEEEEVKKKIKSRKNGSPKPLASWKVKCALVKFMASLLQGCAQLVDCHVIGVGAEDGGQPSTATVVVGSKLVSSVMITVVMVGMVCGLPAIKIVPPGKIRSQLATKDAPQTIQLKNFPQHVVWDTAPSTPGRALSLSLK